jgi:RND superfamily putative drug exporter
MNSRLPRHSPSSLARASARHPWLTIATWVVLFVAAGATVATMLSGGLSSSGHLLNRPDSTRGTELLDQRMPQPNRELVVASSDRYTVDAPAFRDYVAGLTTQIRRLQPNAVSNVLDYYETKMPFLVSADRHSLLVPVAMTGSLDAAQKNVAGLRNAVNAASGPGFTSVMVGAASVSQDFSVAAKKDMSKAEGIGLPLALAVLLVVFGAVVAAGLPIVLAMVAIVLALALTALLGQVLDVSVFATNIITTMGLAVGIDYTLFIVSRFREELARGRSTVDAVTAASSTAGRAVFFSGLTVVLALLGMLIVPNTLFTSLGAGAIFVVAAAVLAALTLLPAVLSLLGPRVNRLKLPYLGRNLLGSRASGETSIWARVAQRVMRRPAIALAIGVAVLLLAASPLFGMKTAVSSVNNLPRSFEAKKAFAVLDRQFSGGLMNPVEIVVDGPAASPQVKAAIGRLTRTLAADKAFGAPLPQIDTAGDLTLLQVAIAGASTGDLAIAKVRELRSTYVPQAFRGSRASVYVTGETASNVDYMGAVNARTPWVIGIVLALSFVLLMLAFRSVVVPATAIVMNLLSVGAAYGLITLVSQKGIGGGILGFQKVEGIEQWVPLFLFSILFGLSMDYHVFILSRIREEYDRSGDNDAAVVHGVGSTAGIITGAALIMVAVFAGMAGGQLMMFQQMGFGLGVAVLLDATVVRLLLVPAAMRVLGKANWYLPAWLEWLPRLNIEGPLSTREVPEPAADVGPRRPHREHAPATPAYGGVTRVVVTNPGRPEA